LLAVPGGHWTAGCCPTISSSRRLLDLADRGDAILPSRDRRTRRDSQAASAPVDPFTGVWAAGVTYLRSREAREAESTVSDLYSRVYEAERPELFFKAVGWRVSGHAMPIRIRRDSR
jgi:2-dehydro-3-deoxy-D-arabinonate dehydratase